MRNKEFCRNIRTSKVIELPSEQIWPTRNQHTRCWNTSPSVIAFEDGDYGHMYGEARWVPLSSIQRLTAVSGCQSSAWNLHTHNPPQGPATR